MEAIMFDKFTDHAKKIINLSREEAGRLGHDYIGTEHILLGLIRQNVCMGGSVLENLGIDLKHLGLDVEKSINTREGVPAIGEVPFTPRAKRVLELAVEEAQRLGTNYIGSEHILLGLIGEGEGVASTVLKQANIDIKKAREMTIYLLGGNLQRQL
jgi:ATP-dependent Clp protease ATP-binding subunit ClpC